MENTPSPWDGRHSAVAHFRPLFEFAHLPAGPLRDTSAACAQLAEALLGTLMDGPELSAGLRKLLEAKDCFVRQSVLDGRWRARVDEVPQ